MIPIDKVSVIKGERYAYCCVDDLSDELKQIIRDELNIICYGKRRVLPDDSSFYSYQETIKEFLIRYDRKSPQTQIGMIGELLAHILISRVFSNLEPISVYFNKEERSIKKGFDLNYLGDDKSSIWYGEVKSGEKQLQTVDAKNIELLSNAKTDLHEKLSSGRRSLWESAIIDVALSIAANREKSVSDLLKSDLTQLQSGSDLTNNGVLVSVLFHDSENRITTEAIENAIESLANAESFSDILVFSIQKSTFSKVVNFLRTEQQND